MNPSWWQRRTPAQIGVISMVGVTLGALVAAALIRLDVEPILTVVGFWVASWFIGQIAGLRLGGRRQRRLLAQAYRELRIPPGARTDRWRPHLRAQIAQYSQFWTRAVGVFVFIVVAAFAIVAAWPSQVGVLVSVGVVVLIGVVVTWRIPEEPRWQNDARFLLIQLDAQDGIRDP